MLLKLVLIASFTLAAVVSFAQRAIPLYPEGVPEAEWSKGEERANREGTIYSRVLHPTLSVYLPAEGTGPRTAVVICPGGGYAELHISREGYRLAEAFNRQGIAAFVLKYRLPRGLDGGSRSLAPLQDAQRAIKTLRDSAAAWNIDPAKVGIMGFSAGGHLAASAGTHYRDMLVQNPSGTSLRPDFMLLVYPVISFNDEFGHAGSRDNLLGREASPDSVRYFSNELQVTKETPPAFLVHSGDDRIVSVTNSIRFYEALNRYGTNAALHIYPKGGHGFGTMPTLEEWFGRCLHWMRSSGLAK